MTPNPSLEANPALDDWLTFGPGETVTVRSGKVDIGQRISTAVALLAADELGIDPGRVEVAPVETGRSPDEGFTSGSQSMARSGNAVRLAAATARRHLLERAAAVLEVDIAALEVDDGTIRSRATNRKTSYWTSPPGGRSASLSIRRRRSGRARPLTMSAARRWRGGWRTSSAAGLASCTT